MKVEEPSPTLESRDAGAGPESGRAADTGRLAWHVPNDDSAHRLHIRMLRVLFAAAVCLAAAIAFGGGQMNWPAAVLGGVVLLALGFYWSWRAFRARRLEAENVWLDDAGLHWTDGSTTGSIPRPQVEGFRLGLDPDTVRAIPALTLILVGGFESQPVELFPPATPADVGALLVQRWRLTEIQPPQARQGELLFQTLETALAEAPRPGDAERLLLACLVAPQLRDDGQWLVFCLPGGCDVCCDPHSGRFRGRFDGTVQAAGVAELADLVEQYVLPSSRELRQQMLAEAEKASLAEAEQLAAADARKAGFRFQGNDRTRCWNIEGARRPLLDFCSRLEDAVARLAPPPPGARPVQFRLGGLQHGVTVEVNRYEGVSGDLLCATPERLGEMAALLRGKLESASPGSTVSVPLALGEGTWTFHFHVEAEDFDPGGALLEDLDAA